MSEVRTEFHPGHGGTSLAVHRMGAGRPVVMLHGLFSSAEINLIKYGTAQILVDAGFEAIMPDRRAHGQSARPHDPAAWPNDVLALDLAALVSELGLVDYDLVGFSLGSRISVLGVLSGLTPRRLVLGGMGLEGLSGWSKRSAHFLSIIDRFGTIPPGDPAYYTQAFMKTMKVDLVAARLLLGSIGDTPASALAGITMPTLVLCGDEDRDNGSPEALVAALPDARHGVIPGTHMSCVTRPEMGEAIRDFLSEA